MRIIGHRGTPTAGCHVENTLPAIGAALEAGADGVEVDVRCTRDDVLVLSHDPDLGRVLGSGAGRGPVIADATWPALRTLPLPERTSVPRLCDVLDLAAYHRAHVVTEVKRDPGHPARTAELLAALLTLRARAEPGWDRVTTTSFDLASAMVLTGRGMGSAVILEPEIDPFPAALRARACGLTELHLSVEHVRADPTVVSRVHELGLTVGAGIVDHVPEARWLQQLGVDLLCTDTPELLVAGMGRSGGAGTRTGARELTRPSRSPV